MVESAHLDAELAVLETRLPQPQPNAFRIFRAVSGDLFLRSVYDLRGRIYHCRLGPDSAAALAAFRDEVATALSEGKARLHRNSSSFAAEAERCERWQSRHGKGSSRRKRSSLMLFPGTNWCGKGNNARYVADFGSAGATDRCCLEHDGCPYIIEGFQSRFHYFNYRFHTLSYCGCDEKFRACLKGAAESPASIVGKLYFNVVNSQCFRLRREKVCAERSWWGTCKRHSIQLVAKIQDQANF